MKQYLLSVHIVEGAPTPSDEEMQTMFRETDRINDDMQAAGAWVFGGGLLPPDSATVVRVENGTTTMTDGPFAETKEQLGGFWVIKCADLDAGAGLGREVRGGLRPGRGAAVRRPVPGLTASRSRHGPGEHLPRGVRPLRRHPGPPPRRHQPRRGGGPGRVRDGAAEVADPAAEPGRLDRDHRPQPGRRPASPRVDPRGPARPGPAAAPTGRARGGGTGARRPAPAHLHLLPPGARSRRADRPHAAPARRPRGAGDRPGLPGAGGDHRPADRARQEEDPRRRHPVPGAGRARAAGPAAARARRALPDVQRGLHGHRRSADQNRPVRRGDPARPRARRADARRARGPRPARPAAADRGAPPGPARPGRRAGAAGRPGPVAVEPGAHRRGPRPRPPLPAPQPARPVPDPGRDQRGAHRRRRHRLGAGPGALRPAPRAGADPGRRAQPCGRGRRGARTGGGPRRVGGRRPARTTTGCPPPGPTCWPGSAATAEAAAAYDEAVALATNDTERAFLAGRRAALDAP